MKITRRQLRRIIKEAIESADNENEEFRAKIINMIQSGDIGYYNQAADLNDTLGLFDPLELGKRFWQLKIMPLNTGTRYFENANEYIEDYLWDILEKQSSHLDNSVTDPLTGTHDSIFKSLTSNLDQDLRVAGHSDIGQWQQHPALLALFREGYDKTIKMLLSDSSIKIEDTPSGELKITMQ